jgi:hypothetical protein
MVRHAALLVLGLFASAACAPARFSPLAYGGTVDAAARATRAEAAVAAERHRREHEAMLRATWGIESGPPAAPPLAAGAVGSEHELGTWDH